jgi:hypothetical protein
MKAFSTYRCAAGNWMGSALVALLILLPLVVAAGVEDKFDLFQIGTRTYTNVTVTTKAKNYIFILHAGGMTSIKTTELSLEMKQQLGYVAASKPGTNTAAVWAKREIAKLNVPSFKQLNQKVDGKLPWQFLAKSLLSSKIMYAALGIMLLVYLFHCYCCMLICLKTGNPPGVLVWVPVLQLFPLLRAAGMSGWWFLAYWVPVLNLVAQVLWCFNIAKARGQSVWFGVLLLLPVINLFAILYLAFSDVAPAEEEIEPEPKIMTLEAA